MFKRREVVASDHSARNPENSVCEFTLPLDYQRASRLVEQGRYEDAQLAYEKLDVKDAPLLFNAIVKNDLAVLMALGTNTSSALLMLHSALKIDDRCEPARINLQLLSEEFGGSTLDLSRNVANEPLFAHPGPPKSCKVAILSFLFNWPSTGGGNIHTTELAKSLVDSGYGVRHFFAVYPDWGIGRVDTPLSFPSEGLDFEKADWSVPRIQARFRQAVDAFHPDFVIITDTWNMKPLLAEAVRSYPYFLRFQALECLCPLNNLRLLAQGPTQIEQCPQHQLATAEACYRCLEEHGRRSGPLHQLERALAGVGTPKYQSALRRALKEAEAVLVLNPVIETMLSPYARRVRVVPWGMDPRRFPWPPPSAALDWTSDGVVTLFMAAVAGEFIKGFHILHEACQRLRRVRSDFELVVTFDPSGRIDEFTRSVGWLSQEELPVHYRAADICVVPTIAQEGLSRTSVESMASGLPVIASRIGGLPYTVADGATGLLFEPGDPDDLARKIATLLDDPPLRRRMGLAGRKRFEEDFTWDVVIERYYKPLLTKRYSIQG